MCPMKHLLIAGAAGLMLSSAAAAQSEATLKVGDDAPSLSIAKWVKGDAVESFKSDSVYMVEFWATW